MTPNPAKIQDGVLGTRRPNITVIFCSRSSLKSEAVTGSSTYQPRRQGHRHMKMNPKLTIATLVGISIGGIGGIAIRGQQVKTAPGYLIAEVEVTDPDKLQNYAERYRKRSRLSTTTLSFAAAKLRLWKATRPRAGSSSSPSTVRRRRVNGTTRRPMPPSGRSGKVQQRVAYSS
jgi:hypothetical protein